MLDESSSIDPGPAAPTRIAPNATTVLVVDDEPSNLESLEKIFQREGMRVLTADGAKHGARASCASTASRSC